MGVVVEDEEICAEKDGVVVVDGVIIAGGKGGTTIDEEVEMEGVDVDVEALACEVGVEIEVEDVGVEVVGVDVDLELDEVEVVEVVGVVVFSTFGSATGVVVIFGVVVAAVVAVAAGGLVESSSNAVCVMCASAEQATPGWLHTSLKFGEYEVVVFEYMAVAAGRRLELKIGGLGFTEGVVPLDDEIDIRNAVRNRVFFIAERTKER